MLFVSLVSVFERIENANGSKKKKEVFVEFINSFRQQYTDVDILYSIIRLVCPDLDIQRKYDMKEASLGNILVEVLGISSDSPDAQLLKSWGSNLQAARQDISLVAQKAFECRCTITDSDASLTVERLNNDYLDKLSDHGATKAQKVAIFNSLLRICTPKELKWIIRIILKQTKFHMSSQTLLHGINKNAPTMLKFNTNLHSLCHEFFKTPLESTENNFEDFKITLFSQFMAMKLQKCLPTDVKKLIGCDKFWIEEKLDGHRMILHMAGRQFRYFGRDGADHTYQYGALATEKFSKRIFDLLHKDARTENLILDGEMLVYDPLIKSYQPFGQLTSFVNYEPSSNDPRPCFVVFDVLLVNETDMTRVPLCKRREWLNNLVNEEEGTLSILKYKEASTVEEVIDEMEAILQNKGEGIVIKDPSSLYRPGDRRKTWLKCKPDFISHLGENMDVAVVGMYRGKGSRSHLFSSFLCAVREDVENATCPPQNNSDTRWLSLTKVGIGFSLTELNSLTSELPRVGIESRGLNNIPTWLDQGKKIIKEVPDIWLAPWDANLVLQIKASELVSSDTVGTKITLRFPRFVQKRSDKFWWDCSTLLQVQNLYSNTKGIKAHLIKQDGTVLGGGTVVKASPKKINASLISSQKFADLSKVSVESSLFEGIWFSVITGVNGDSLQSKNALEVLIKANGGQVTATPIEQTQIVVVGDKNMRSKGYIKLDNPPFDVVSSKWIIDSVAHQQKIPFQPRYLLNSRDETLKDMLKNMDKYGDFYTKFVNNDELSLLFETMDIDHLRMDETEMLEFVAENDVELTESCFDFLFSLVLLFDNHFEHVDDSNILVDENEVLKLIVRFRGAIVVDSFEAPVHVTHVVVQNDPRAKVYHQQFHGHVRRPLIVRKEWLLECIEKRTIIDETKYIM